jgi:hypothetical protein
MGIVQNLQTLLNEKKMWSAKVETEWHPKEGFFSQSAEKIASGLKRASTDLKQAMSRLNFYKNRAGKNLSAEDKARLDTAKEKLHALYECVNEAKEPVYKTKVTYRIGDDMDYILIITDSDPEDISDKTWQSLVHDNMNKPPVGLKPGDIKIIKWKRLSGPKENVNESKTITAKSGLKGWQDKLRKVYDSFEEFEDYCKTYNIHKRLGYKTPEDAWEANPTIQGSIEPSDLRKVKSECTMKPGAPKQPGMKTLKEKQSGSEWVQLTKRTEDPKLSWLEDQLKDNGIEFRRHGESFHAPILQVKKADYDKAMEILEPIDDIPDDDPKYAEYAEYAMDESRKLKQPGIKNLKEAKKSLRDTVLTAKKDGKTYHVVNIGNETAMLVPEDGEYSDKIRVVIGDFYEDYDLYDSKKKLVHTATMGEAIEKRGSQNREKLSDLKDEYTLITKRPIGAKIPTEVVLYNIPAKKQEVWGLSDDFAGYVIEINGKGYEFIRSLTKKEE